MVSADITRAAYAFSPHKLGRCVSPHKLGRCVGTAITYCQGSGWYTDNGTWPQRWQCSRSRRSCRSSPPWRDHMSHTIIVALVSVGEAIRQASNKLVDGMNQPVNHCGASSHVCHAGLPVAGEVAASHCQEVCQYNSRAKDSLVDLHACLLESTSLNRNDRESARQTQGRADKPQTLTPWTSVCLYRMLCTDTDQVRSWPASRRPVKSPLQRKKCRHSLHC